MRFQLNERKAAQAAAYILRKRGPLTYGQLVKLLYLADRRKLLDRGTPITGDRVVAMEHGIVLSIILNLMRKGKCGNYGPEWHRYISRPDGQVVTAVGDDDTDELSRYELGILDEVEGRYGHLTFTQLRKLTHGLGEYSDPNPKGSSKTITPERILEKGGYSKEEIALVEEKAQALRAIDSLPK